MGHVNSVLMAFIEFETRRFFRKPFCSRFLSSLPAIGIPMRAYFIRSGKRDVRHAHAASKQSRADMDARPEGKLLSTSGSRLRSADPNNRSHQSRRQIGPSNFTSQTTKKDTRLIKKLVETLCNINQMLVHGHSAIEGLVARNLFLGSAFLLPMPPNGTVPFGDDPKTSALDLNGQSARAR